MKQNKKNEKGREGFESYYSELFGSRWQKLKESFSKETDSVEYKVPGAEKSYFLDSASVLAALSLPLKNKKNILDLCAAPGGKTLVLSSRMDDDAKLSSNERSPQRKHRLSVVVETCLPPEINERITVSCSDGASWCTRQSECFDAILLDAPCSSERHVYNDEKYLNEWSTSRIKTVTMEQWALFSCACRLLQVNGYILYSTCALSPLENDLMIEKVFKKFNKNQKVFEIAEPFADKKEIEKFCKINLPEVEKTTYGYQILPDVQNGSGPIYFCLLKKICSFKSL